MKNLQHRELKLMTTLMYLCEESYNTPYRRNYSNQDHWVVQTISGQIQLSISHWNYSYSTSSWSLYPVKYNIFTLRSFTLTMSDNFLYLTYTMKFPLNGLDSWVVQTYPNPTSSNDSRTTVQYTEQRRVFWDVMSLGGTNSSLTLWWHSFTSQKTWTFSKNAVTTSNPTFIRYILQQSKHPTYEISTV